MTLYPLIILAAAFICGMPVAFAMILCIIPYFVLDPTSQMTVIIQKLIAGTESFSLAAIPFFIIAGSIMNYSGISERLFRLADALVGHLTGGLGHVNILLSTLMGGISGSGAADAAMESKLLVPEMVKHGYSLEYSAAVTAASACITPIIPPGVGLVVYACIMQVSVGKLLCAGYIPGLMICVGMMICNHIISKKRGYKAASDHMLPGKQILKLFLDALWALFIPFGLVMALRIGLCTPTEGGAMMAVYALLVGKFIYKELKITDLPKIMLDGATNTACIMMIMAGANVLSHYLSWEGIPTWLTQSMTQNVPNKYVFLAISMALLLVLGMFMDGMAAMIVIAPLLAPVGAQMGVNMVHYGLIMCLNCAIGAITPPFGNYNFLVAGTVKCSTSKMIKEIIPYIIVCIAVLILCTYIPGFVTIIPKLVYGNV